MWHKGKGDGTRRREKQHNGRDEAIGGEPTSSRGDDAMPARSLSRAIAVGAGTAAVGALLLVGTSASATRAPADPVALATAHSDAAPAVGIVPAEGDRLVGFAPPAKPAALSVDAQFRLAANLPSGPLGIPGPVLQAYKLAATKVAAESPQCRLPWYLLAGIGRIESGHAGGGNVDQYGNTRTKIRGPVLDGSLAGNAVIRDSDGGRWDGDTGHDRAMGPMQFIPSTWAAWGADANGDGKADPDNIFDATYSAGRYLCAGVTDIMAEGSRVQNILRYNRSVPYANNVLGWAAAYAAGVMPTTPIPEMSHAPSDEGARRNRDTPGTTKPETTPPSTTTPAPAPIPTCVGDLCLPPDLIPGLGQPAPQQTPQPPQPAPRQQGQQQGQGRQQGQGQHR